MTKIPAACFWQADFWYNCALSVRIHGIQLTTRREQMGLPVVQKLWTPRKAHTKKEQG